MIEVNIGDILMLIATGLLILGVTIKMIKGSL